ncbi:MAG: PD-(D/E)XK nuclease family protein [Alphaproteobacteria bacterium]|nr:PD-(D/E)XK nuclease family protein [Alphaproteobacteria bacterium]
MGDRAASWPINRHPGGAPSLPESWATSMAAPLSALRASMLPSWPDCPRRGAAKQWRRDINASGYHLRESRSSVGAAVGTAVHAAAAHFLPIWTEPGAVSAAVEVAVLSFRADSAQGMVWDKNNIATPNIAEFQIRRMVAVYAEHVAPHVQPALVEQALQVSIGGGFWLSGHADIIVTGTRVVRDLKTGAQMRSYQAQLGGYSLLVRSQPEPIDVAGVAVDFIRRTPKTKPQNMPVSEALNLDVAERTAWSVIGHIKAAVTEFRRRLVCGIEPPEEAFLANPMSQMCHADYCPAHGIDFCPLGRHP